MANVQLQAMVATPLRSLQGWGRTVAMVDDRLDGAPALVQANVSVSPTHKAGEAREIAILVLPYEVAIRLKTPAVEHGE